MKWWALLAMLAVCAWQLVETVDRDPNSAWVWLVALMVTCAVIFVSYADQENLWDWERDNSRVHAFQTIGEEE